MVEEPIIPNLLHSEQTHHPHNIIISSSSCILMGRRRAQESVPATEQGIEEVVIKHRQTRSGVRTSNTTLPVLIPVKKKHGKSSRSSKEDRAQVDVESVGRSTPLDTGIDDLQVPQYIDEHVVDDVLDDNILLDKSAKTTVHNHTPFQ